MEAEQSPQDQTFSAADLLRFWTFNLTDKERQDVVLTFSYLYAVSVVREPSKPIFWASLALVEVIAPIVWRPVIRIIRRILLAVFGANEVNRVLAAVDRVFEGNPRRQARALRAYEKLE